MGLRFAADSVACGVVWFKGLGFEDGVSAIISLCSVAAYYFGLYLGKNKIDKKIEFTIIKE